MLFGKPLLGELLDYSDPLTRGLVGLWLFNEGSGNKVFDLSGNKFTMDTVGSPVWTAGQFGSTILVNGSSQYLLNNNAPITGVPLTLACWFNSDDTTNAQNLISIQDTSANRQRFRISAMGNRAGDTLFAQTRTDGANQPFAESVNGYTANKWHLAVGVFSAVNSRKIYLDGVFEAEETTSNTPSGLANTSIGVIFRTADNIQYFSGSLGPCYIWNLALSASEIALLYREPFRFIGIRRREGAIAGGVSVAVPGGIVVLRRRIEAA